jgi:hypothetical protein
MEINLWVFLTVTIVFTMSLLIIIASNAHKKKLKELEVEALRIEKLNLKSVVEDAVNKSVGDQLSRIEVLEAIVTDKNYELNEKITRLK